MGPLIEIWEILVQKNHMIESVPPSDGVVRVTEGVRQESVSRAAGSVPL